MGICKFCGKDSGWFTEAHKECVQLAETGYQQVLATVKQSVASGNSYAETKISLDGVIFLDRVPADRVHQAYVEGWSEAGEQAGALEPLSPDKYAAMTQ